MVQCMNYLVETGCKSFQSISTTLERTKLVCNRIILYNTVGDDMPKRTSMMLKFSTDLQAVKDELAGNDSVVDGYFLYTLCRRPDETSVHITSFGCISDVDAMIGRLEILKKVMIQAYEADRENEHSMDPSSSNPDVLEILRNLETKGKGN